MTFVQGGRILDLDEQEEHIELQIAELDRINAEPQKSALPNMLDAWRLRFRRFARSYFPDVVEELIRIETRSRPSIAPFVEIILKPILEDIARAKNALPRESRLDRSQWEKLRRLKKKMDPGGHFLGESAATLRLFRRVEELNQYPDDPILLLGPTGSGKTHIAQLVHLSRHPGDKELEKFHRESATVSATTDFAFVLERLLGHGKNSSLYGASKNEKPGKLETHEDGTLFVDEIAEATPLFQTLIFDILDRLPLESPFGDARPFKTNISLIFATNYEPDLAVIHGPLKADFVARIGKRIVRLAPLRRRLLDIFSFVRKYCPEILERSKSFRVQAKDRLRRSRFLVILLKHNWPANTRELIEVLKAAEACRKVLGDPVLTHLHLDIGNRQITEEVSSMSDDDVMNFLFNKCASLVEEIGFEEQTGRDTELSQLLGWPPSTLVKLRDNIC